MDLLAEGVSWNATLDLMTSLDKRVVVQTDINSGEHYHGILRSVDAYRNLILSDCVHVTPTQLKAVGTIVLPSNTVILLAVVNQTKPSPRTSVAKHSIKKKKYRIKTSSKVV